MFHEWNTPNFVPKERFMVNKKWDTSLISDQNGKVVVITGGNAGLGYQMSLEMAKKNATVVIACRSREKGQKAVQSIQQAIGNKADLHVIQLDLADLRSVKQFSEEFKSRFDKLDILINNAGVVNLKDRQETPTGLEMHMATNHYGHFALTKYLLPIILKTENARVVTMSSGSYRFGTIDFDDLNWNKRKYNRGSCYGDSKLANMLFMKKLQRLFEEKGISAISVAAHPGLSATERQQTIGIGGKLSKIMAQPVYMGALPALLAATDSNVHGGTYYGPRWKIRGYPRLEKLNSIVEDRQLADRLWETSEMIIKSN